MRGLDWPGDGTMRLPADEAHAFTVHEFAKPRVAALEASLVKDQQWVVTLLGELRALIATPDRPMAEIDLVFAATSRCRCGAGYCYPIMLHDTTGSWVCSAIVLGTAAADSEHDCAKPFAFWSLKSERQPSANGATTRPA